MKSFVSVLGVIIVGVIIYLVFIPDGLEETIYTCSCTDEGVVVFIGPDTTVYNVSCTEDSVVVEYDGPDIPLTFSCTEDGDVEFTGPDTTTYSISCLENGTVVFIGPDTTLTEISYTATDGNILTVISASSSTENAEVFEVTYTFSCDEEGVVISIGPDTTTYHVICTEDSVEYDGPPIQLEFSCTEEGDVGFTGPDTTIYSISCLEDGDVVFIGPDTTVSEIQYMNETMVLSEPLN